jgi:choline dehydrogenase
MTDRREIPSGADVIVLGGGTAGAVTAGLLAELSDANVMLFEAGPDYGPVDSGRWPHDLLDAATLAMVSHDWGYGGDVNGRRVAFNRAKVIGGCSSHNGGAAVKGSRLDYDGWAAAGNPGWATEDLLPLFDSAWERFCVRPIGPDDLTPFQAACTDGLVHAGIPVVDDFNDLDENVGVAPFPINIDSHGRRINSAFAYLDPVRDTGNLTVVGDATAERVLLDGTRAVGAVVRTGEGELTVRAPRVVLCAGAYGSPAILQRSGIGPEKVLAAAGVEVTHELAVGENLHDQPTLEVDYTGSDALLASMRRFGDQRWRPDEQVIAKFPSSDCRQGFDLHIFPLGGSDPLRPGEWRWTIAAALLSPDSRGYVRIAGPTSGDPVRIDHRFLTDPEGRDAARLVEAVERIRETASEPQLAALLGEERFPGAGVRSPAEVRACVEGTSVHYWHPVGSCKMGPPEDDTAVVGAEGGVHGVEGLHVADASIMPWVMSGNTNMPCAVIGERMARQLAGAPALSRA